jgi:hypothetical protein
MFSAFLGTGAVAALYLLGRFWFSPAVGLVAAALLAALPYHLFWSRNPLNNVGDTLALILILLFASRALATSRRFDYALAGLCLGLGQYAYQSARLAFVIIALLAVREYVASPRLLRHNITNLMIFAGGLCVTLLPQAADFASNPTAYLGRFQGVSIFSSGWLAREIEQTGQSALSILAELFRRSLLVFTHVLPRVHYDPGRPLLDPLSSIFFLIGLLCCVWSLRQRAYFALLISLGAFVSGVALTENAPSSSRAVVLGPLGMLLVAIGIVQAGWASARLLRGWLAHRGRECHSADLRARSPLFLPSVHRDLRYWGRADHGARLLHASVPPGDALRLRRVAAPELHQPRKPLIHRSRLDMCRRTGTRRWSAVA